MTLMMLHIRVRPLAANGGVYVENISKINFAVALFARTICK